MHILPILGLVNSLMVETFLITTGSSNILD